MPASCLQIPVGGMWVQCFGVSELLASREADKEAAVLFFLHGRFGSAERIEHLVQKVYDDATALASSSSVAQEGLPAGDVAPSSAAETAADTASNDSPVTPAGRPKHLIIVTFDQRNHGTRKISHKGQQSWSEGNLEHAQSMLAMQTGTAADVSFLADFLPSHLFPQDEARISQWAVTGISLGGHSTWIVLRNDPRFDVGIPMLGCPAYRVLMKHRAASNNVPFEPPYMPRSLLSLLERTDPDSVDYTNPSPSSPSDNPYLGKKILALHGEADELVPWECTKAFADALEVGAHGRKEVKLEPGRGHECSAFMLAELVKWVVRYGMQGAPTSESG